MQEDALISELSEAVGEDNVLSEPAVFGGCAFQSFVSIEGTIPCIHGPVGG